MALLLFFVLCSLFLVCIRTIVEAESVQPEQPSTPPLQPAESRVGAGLAASDAAALAGAGRADSARAAAGLPPDMLPLPRQRARRRRAQPQLRAHLCVYQRLRRAAAQYPGRRVHSRCRRHIGRDAAPPCRERAWHLARGLLLAAPR